MSPFATVLFMMGLLLLLGCFLDPLSIMMITLPFFIPLVRVLGLDQAWFGVSMLLALEIGFLTPPFGMLLFVMKGVAPEGTTMREIVAAAMPFVLLEIVALGIILLVPAIVTWLPSLSR